MPGKVKFVDEIPALTKEANALYKKGVKIIIAVGHSGFDKDREIAQKVPHLDLVVGGHSNTFLYTGEPLPSIERPEGNYPFLVEQKNGREVPVVQAFCHTKYLGYLKLSFDENGELSKYEGNPKLLDNTLPQGRAYSKFLASNCDSR